MHKRITKVTAISFLLALTIISCEEYMTENPFADPREKFLGTWKCHEERVPFDGLWVYDVTITRNPQNSSEILIFNFNLQGATERARAMVTGNKLIIPQQWICDNTIQIQGSGSYQDGEILLSYTTNDGADLKQFNARYFKP